MEDILAHLSWSTQGEGTDLARLRLGREDDEDDYSMLDNSSFGRDKAVRSGGESNLDTPLCKGGGSPTLGSTFGGGEIVFQSRSVKAQGQGHTPAPCQ